MYVDLEERVETWDVDPQIGSPLFTKLPPEIRHHIFAFALTPRDIFMNNWLKYEFAEDCTDAPDFRIRYDHEGELDEDEMSLAASKKSADTYGHRYPNDTGPCCHHQLLSPTLLQVCRRVFGEARLLLFDNERGFDYCKLGITERPTGPTDYEQRMADKPGLFKRRTILGFWSRQRTEWERRFTNISLSAALGDWWNFLGNDTQDYIYRGLSYASDRATTKRYPWTRVEHLRLMVSFDEDIERNQGFFGRMWPLLKRQQTSNGGQLTLMQNVALAAIRHRKSKEEKAEGTVPGPDKGHEVTVANNDEFLQRPSWVPAGIDQYILGSVAREFVNWPKIQTLTMNFHSHEILLEEHEAIIEWIMDTWRFPLNPSHAGYHYLSAERVEKMSWRGQKAHWQQCGRSPSSVKMVCATATEREAKSPMDHGPRMYTWTVTWTRKKHDGPEVYPYGKLVQVDERDWQEEGDSDLDEDEEVDWIGLGMKPPLEEERGTRRNKKDFKDKDEEGGEL